GSCSILRTSLIATAWDWALLSACMSRPNPPVAVLSSSIWVRRYASSLAWPICCPYLNRRRTVVPVSHNNSRPCEADGKSLTHSWRQAVERKNNRLIIEDSADRQRARR